MRTNPDRAILFLPIHLLIILIVVLVIQARADIKPSSSVSTANVPTAENSSTAQPQAVSENKSAVELKRPIIEEVRFVDDEGKKVFINVKLLQVKNAPLDLNLLSEDAQKIRDAHPEYASVSTKLDPVKNNKYKVRIIFEFLRKRIIRDVRVVTQKGVDSPTEITKKIYSRPGQMLRGDEVQKDKEILRQIFVAEGYPKTQVTHKVLKHDSGQGSVQVTFDVKTNSPQIYIDQVRFVGAKAYTASTLSSLIETRKEWYSGMTGGVLFNALNLESDAKKIKDFYNSKGFADFKIKFGYQITSGNQAVVTYQVEEGQKYLIKSLSIKGLKVATKEQIQSLLGFSAPAVYDGKKLRQSLQKIREYYGERGYSLAQVGLDFNTKNGKLEFAIEEGEVQFVERIEIKGNNTIEEKIIRSYFDVKEGKVINTTSLNHSIEKLRKTGYFEEIQVTHAPSRENFNVVTVQVNEARRSSIEFGFGYGTSSGLSGDAGASYRKDGMDFSVWGAKSAEEEKLMFIFKSPHLFQSKYDVTASAGYQKSEYPGFDKRSLQIKALVEREVIRNLTLGFGTRVEYVRIEDVQSTLPPEAINTADRWQIVGGLVGTLVYENEKIDETGEGYSGYKIRMTMLPSYSEKGAFFKASANAVGHVTVGTDQLDRKHIISGRVTVGYASSKTPFFEKMYGGGTGTIRGFSSRSITPTGSPLGGNVLAGTGAYYSFPLYGKMFRGVAFVETLGVSNDFNSFGDIRVSTGIGVRANLRETFLRTNVEAGWAVPVIKQSGDKLKPFYLLFGTYHPVYDL